MILLHSTWGDAAIWALLGLLIAFLLGLLIGYLLWNKYKAMVAEWESRYNAKTNEWNSLNSRYVKLESDSKALEPKLSQMSNQLNAAAHAKTDLQDQLSAALARIPNFESELAIAARKAADSEASAASARARLGDIEGSINGLKDKIKVLSPFEAKFLKALKETETLKYEIARLRNKNKDLKDAAAKAADTPEVLAAAAPVIDDGLSAKYEAALREIEGLKKGSADSDSLHDLLATAQNKNHELNLRLSLAKKENKKLDKGLHKAEAVADKLEHEVEVAEAKADKAEDERDAVLARIKANAAKINFEKIGTATDADKDDLKKISGVGPFLEEKLNHLGIYTFKQVANFDAEDEEMVNEAIEFFPGRIKRDYWVLQAKCFCGDKEACKQVKALKKQADLDRVSSRKGEIDFGTIGTATAASKDDLKIISGVGPFIEEKLNSMDIFTFEQVSKFTPAIEQKVTDIIEFFPGRIARDEWAKQAAKLAEEKK